MKQVVYICDRCGTTVAEAWQTVADDDWGVVRVETDPLPSGPKDWRTIPDETAVHDVCPRCLTDAEAVDFLLAHVEAEAAIPSERED